MPAHKNAYTTLSTIGLTFGVSAKQVGKVLSEQGYREPKTLNPTPLALKKELAVRSHIATGQQFWMWKAKDLVEIMENTGWVKRPKDDVRAATTTAEIARLLKGASSLNSWNGKKAVALVEQFVPNATATHLQTLLAAIKKSNASLFPLFQQQYEAIAVRKQLHEVVALEITQSPTPPKSKL